MMHLEQETKKAYNNERREKKKIHLHYICIIYKSQWIHTITMTSDAKTDINTLLLASYTKKLRKQASHSRVTGKQCISSNDTITTSKKA
jgi:hypothetical protein